jgi:cytochrome c oxidase subunit 2
MKSIWRNKYRPANLLLAAGAAFSSAAHAVNDLPGGPSVRQLNLPVGVTKIAQEQHLLHTIMMILCTVIFVAVFAVMFYSIWKHRKSVGHKAANFHESVVVEVIWTIVPFLIVIVMALPATKVLVAQKDTTNADLTIKTTGYQWKWGYDYLNGEGRAWLHVHAGQLAPRHVQRRRQGRDARRLPAQGRQPAGGAGQQEGAHHHHRQRRDPRLGRAAASA